VEGEAVVEAFICEVNEILRGDGRFLFVEFEFYRSFYGFQDCSSVGHDYQGSLDGVMVYVLFEKNFCPVNLFILSIATLLLSLP
jgi:hypothetical protein